MLFELGYGITQRGESSGATRASRMPLRKKISLSSYTANAYRARWLRFPDDYAGGDIGIFQHHHFTPGEQGGKNNTTIKQRLTT